MKSNSIHIEAIKRYLFVVAILVTSINSTLNAVEYWSGTMTAPISVNIGETKEVQLIGDVNIGDIVVSGNMTVDLNGYVLNRNEHRDYIFKINNTGVLLLIQIQIHLTLALHRLNRHKANLSHICGCTIQMHCR